MEETYVAKPREIHNENVEGTEGSWVPWKVAAEKEGGEELLKEMVEAGTVVCRRNPKLPATTKIPWPQNQEVQHIVETFSRKKRKVESECKEDGAGDLANFQEAWHSQAAHVTASTNPGTTNTNNPPDSNKASKDDKVDPASKAAIKNIKMACNNKK